MTVAGLRLDPVALRVWNADHELVVTARTFDVVEFIARRDGQVVSKSAIPRGVWNDDFDGDPNIRACGRRTREPQRGHRRPRSRMQMRGNEWRNPVIITRQLEEPRPRPRGPIAP